MTKAQTTTGPTIAGTEPAIDISAPVTKVKRQRNLSASKANPTIAASTDTPLTETRIGSPTLMLPRLTKVALLRARLSAPGGASRAALIEATGWQAHTLRAALSGLRKKGLTLTRRREGEATVYAIERGGSEAVGVADHSAPGATPEAPAETSSGKALAVHDRTDGVTDAACASLLAEPNA